MLDILRLLLSKDARETVRSLARLRPAEADWRKDLLLINESFSNAQRLELDLLRTFVADSLAARQWPGDKIKTGVFVLNELVTNALEHGVPDGTNAKIKLRIKLSKAFLEVVVSNPRSSFSLEDAVSSSKKARDTDQRQGIALRAIARNISHLEQKDQGRTVRAIVRPGYRPVKISRYERCLVFSFFHESEVSRTFWSAIATAIDEAPVDHRIVLDFSQVDDVSTRIISELEALVVKAAPPSEVDATPLALSSARERIMICGVQKVNDVLRSYLYSQFTTVESCQELMAECGAQVGAGQQTHARPPQ